MRQTVVAPLMGLTFLILLMGYVDWRSALGASYNWMADHHLGWPEKILEAWHDAQADRDRSILDGFHAHGRRTSVANHEIDILAIDEASLKLTAAFKEDIAQSETLQAMNHRFPWPRRVWAAVIDRLADAGAAAIFLDLVFVAPSQDADDDRLLKEAFERHRDKVVLGAKFDYSEINGGKNSDLINSDLIYPSATITGSEIPPPGTFGHLSFWIDEGAVRDVRYLVTQAEAEALAAGRVVARIDDVSIPAVSFVLGQELNPRRASQVHRKERLRFAANDAFAPLSLHTIFVPALWKANFQSGKFFQGKVVIVGSTAAEMHDDFNTPIGNIPGVMLHANALNCLLQTSFVHPAPANWTWGSLVGGLLLSWVLVSLLQQPVTALLGIWTLTIGIYWGSFYAFDHWNVEASPLPACLTLNVCGIAGLVGNFFVQLREKQRLFRYLGRYTSPQIAQEMMKDRAGVFITLRGTEKVATVFFSDIRGFTTLSETTPAPILVPRLNEYFGRMVACVVEKRGWVDKFIGDAVMAIWGTERFEQTNDTLRQDALNAVSASLAMREALKELNADWASQNIEPFAIGMGVHQGPVVVGNIGSLAPYEKMGFTVIGDSVNLASRLESLTKKYGVDFIISEAVEQHVREDFLSRSVDFVSVKGKALPVKVFTVLGPKAAPPPDGLTEFEEGIQHYRQGDFTEALAAFERAAERGLADVLTKVYQDRCHHLLEEPPEKWDGVYIMKEK